MPKMGITKRPDGRYLARRDGLFFFGKTASEALEKRKAYDLAKEQNLVHDKHGKTIEDYAYQWLEVHRHDSCPKSKKLYRKILDNFIDVVGNIRLQDVTPTMIKSFYNSLVGYSQSHICKNVTTITGMFRSAVDDRLILKDPCVNVVPPSGKSGSHRIIEDWERLAIHQLVDERMGVAVMLMLYAGLRKGEALAFDLDRDIVGGRVFVREAVSFSYEESSVIKETKTAAGIRELPLFQPLADAIVGRSGKAFSTVRGGPVTDTAFVSAWNTYKRAFEKLTGKPCTIRTHDLRHTFCTTICEAGVDIKTAMNWMGHSDETMIRRIYDHITEAREKRSEALVAKQLAEVCLGSQFESQKKTVRHRPLRHNNLE